MSEHNNVQLKLYEFLRDELSTTERSLIEAHLATCSECTNELQNLREAISLLPAPTSHASDERSEEFWNALSSRVVEKATAERITRKNPIIGIVDWIEEAFLLHPKYRYAVSGALAGMIAAVAFWTFAIHEKQALTLSGNSIPFQHTTTPASPQEDFGVPVERVNQYFRKSKTLLVGLANLRGSQEEPLDFSNERRVSRDLIRESRYLKQQRIDPQSRQLMNDLERILIELANIEEHKDLPNVEIVRGGIHQENLLFKIRMAEAMYDSTGFRYASEHRQ